MHVPPEEAQPNKSPTSLCLAAVELLGVEGCSEAQEGSWRRALNAVLGALGLLPRGTSLALRSRGAGGLLSTSRSWGSDSSHGTSAWCHWCSCHNLCRAGEPDWRDSPRIRSTDLVWIFFSNYFVVCWRPFWEAVDLRLVNVMEKRDICIFSQDRGKGSFCFTLASFFRAVV